MIKTADKYKQWFAIGSSMLLLIGLFSLDIKGLESNKKSSTNNSAEDKAAPMIAAKKDIKQLSIEAILSGTHDQSTDENVFHKLEEKVALFEKSSAAEQRKIAKELSASFLAISNPGASAFFDEVNLAGSNDAEKMEATADKYIDAYNLLQNNEDLQLSFLKHASTLYAKILETDSNNLDAKIGKGITLVNGLGMPMEGIKLLLEVVDRDPKNIKANMNLGLFSMKSGQFDKAVERFETVISVKPDAESYFYLGTAYENLKENQKAVEAFTNSKRLASNATLNDFIDKKVKELLQREN